MKTLSLHTRWRHFSILLLVSFLSTLIIHLARYSQDVNAQEQPVWQPCVPEYDSRDGERTRFHQVSTSSYEGETYYLFHSYAENKTGYHDLIISSPNDDNTCEVDLWNPMGDRLQFSNFIPMPIARQLVRDQFLWIIDEIGRETYENSLQNSVNSGFTSQDLFPEEIWALRQLQEEIGLQVPEELLAIQE